MHGGIQLLVDRVARHAPSIRARVVTIDSAGAAAHDAAAPFEVRRVRVPAGSKRAANALLNAVAIAEAARFRPDAVLSAHVVVAPAARIVGRALGIPVVQYLYANEAAARPRLTRFALNGAAAAIAISGFTERLAREAGADPRRLHRIPPGVDLPEPSGEPRAAQPTLVTIARLRDPYKGHDTILRALPAVRKRVPDVRWVVIGDGPLRPRLERLAAAQEVADCTTFLGNVPDHERDRWLERAHLFAMPSRLPPDGGGEGFGIVYLEAAARGLPVVAGNVGGALDAVVDGETGLLVDPESPAAVGAAIGDLLTDARRAEELGRRGAERAREFAWPAIARRVEDLVLGLVPRP